jgi:hypothetical protein
MQPAKVETKKAAITKNIIARTMTNLLMDNDESILNLGYEGQNTGTEIAGKRRRRKSTCDGVQQIQKFLLAQ